MIKATELRIGNLFMTEYNETLVVGGVMNCDVESEDGKNDWHKVEYVQATNGDNFGFEQVYGIPLTEDWLIRVGFEKKKDGWFRILYNTPHEVCGIDYNISSGRLAMFEFDEGYPSYCKYKIQYVHQLQNLFFALSGEELTIK